MPTAPPDGDDAGAGAHGEREARYRASSLWLGQVEGSLAPRPPLDTDIDCDVAIVGGGFTGLWSAYYLKLHQPDTRVVVLEREIVGFGPSGRNGGWAIGGLSGSPAAYGCARDDPAVVRALRATHEAIDQIAAVVEREQIDCGLIKRGALTVATSAPQWQRLRSRDADAAAGAGADAPDGQLLSAGETAAIVRVPGLHGARFTPHAARVDPARLVRGLAAACERRGVTIHERTAADSIEPGLVRTAAGATLRSPVVIRATESYTTQLRGQRLRYLPLYSLMVATAPLQADIWEELGWPEGLLIDDRHHLFFYAQRTADGRIAIGGRGAPYRLRAPINAANERNAQVRERLIATLRRAFPPAGAAEITHHWGGPLAAPRDWSMAIEFDRRSGLGTAGGYTGHGVAASHIAGATLADLILGRDSDLVTLPWVGHRSRRWEPEPLRFLASRAIVATLGAADRREDSSGRADWRVRALRPFLPPVH
jgi:glycine/D-amino acid oxidase-like deaminating enzyme